MKPFPRRTLLLMVLALLAFARLYWATHHEAPAGPPEVRLIVLDAGDHD
jgi:hypothetical protein